MLSFTRLQATTVVVSALFVAGCASTTTGTPTPVDPNTAGGAIAEVVDPCAVLSIDDLAGTYLRTNLPLTTTHRLDPAAYHSAGMASCRYGTSEQTGVSLSFPLGDKPRDVADLIGAGYSEKARDIDLDGGGKAVFLDDDLYVSIAAGRGDNQFVLEWRSLDILDNETISQPQMVELATMVAGRLPATELDFSDQRPTECESLPRVDDVVGGATLSWGSADGDNLYCDYLGPDGIILAEATKYDADGIEHRIDSARRVRPEEEITPAVADDAALFGYGFGAGENGQRDGLQIEGFLRLCCELSVEFHTLTGGIDGRRSPDFDPVERELVTGFVTAARSWVTT